jgi:PTH1 family peptidyl-tRNA hydrolase
MLNWLRLFIGKGDMISEGRPEGIALVVGLGNPGPRYQRTRHNIGFLVVERLAARHGFRIDRQFRRALVGVWASPQGSVVVAEPQTFMNASGESAVTIARFYHLQPEQVLVVCDDVSLPFGRLRVRRAGSEGGHNGLRSLAQHLGTREYPRLRVGVDRPPQNMDMIDYVLSSFSSTEWTALPEVIDRAADAVETAVAEGIEVVMNRFNAHPGVDAG